jgi:hypothetical protein
MVVDFNQEGEICGVQQVTRQILRYDLSHILRHRAGMDVFWSVSRLTNYEINLLGILVLSQKKTVYNTFLGGGGR